MADSSTTPLIGQVVKNAALEVRAGFVRKVYSILCVQLAFTAALGAAIVHQGPAWVKANGWLSAMSLVGMLVTVFIMLCCSEQLRRFPNNYIVLCLLTVSMGISVGCTCTRYPTHVVLLAAGTTVGIFAGMTLYAWTTKTDFTGMGPYLFAAVITLIVFGLALSILNAFGVHLKMLHVAYNALGVLLFTFYIVFDTQLMMGEYGGHQCSFGIDDYAFAAIALYMDIINLFLHLLELFGNRN
eukprot:TRINITY_DN86942_c0_g1_i1.p1 TRINITY_DN86942_c0_g1~~TRINITY_DN86942_c0_g1_i1.p1  ORF type:complete len:241 (+),score=56.54 TRINITY_DN86942_c0_g1_i1:86-808(+)